MLDIIIPVEAKIIIFHGNPTPDQALAGRTKGWKRFFRYVRTPQWLKDCWK